MHSVFNTKFMDPDNRVLPICIIWGIKLLIHSWLPKFTETFISFELPKQEICTPNTDENQQS